MTFGPNHYVPVLKVKPGEKHALAKLAPKVAARLTPLLEVVETKDKEFARHLASSFEGLTEAVGRFERFFLDLRELEPDGTPAARAVFTRAKQAGLPFVPVLGLTRTFDLKPALKHGSRGFGLRVRVEDLEGANLGPKIHAFVKKHSLRADLVDLIVDLGPVDDMIFAGLSNLMRTFVAEIPEPTSWRTLTIIGSSFPKTMGVVPRASFLLQDRVEWHAWCQELHRHRQSLPRLPTFGDWAIQHPSGVEGFDPRTMKASAAVRYVVGGQWLLIKGVSSGIQRPSLQFPDLATRLALGGLKAHFSGAHHCAGCAGVAAAAAGAPKFGSPVVWRRLGTIHHLTTATEQIAALPWP